MYGPARGAPCDGGRELELGGNALIHDHDNQSQSGETPLPIAGRRRRLIAYFVDALIFFAVFTLLHLVLAGSLRRHISLVQDDLALLAQALYEIAFAMRQGDRRGQTLGKQLLRIRVVRADRQPLGLSDLVIREAARNVLLGASYVSQSVVLSLVGLIDPTWAMVNDQNRAVHDLLARTVVVSTNRSRAQADDDRLWEEAVSERGPATAVSRPIRLRDVVSPDASAADQLNAISEVDRRFGAAVLLARIKRIVGAWEQSSQGAEDRLSDVASDAAVDMLLHGPAGGEPLGLILRDARVDSWTTMALELSAAPQIQVAIVVSAVLYAVWDRTGRTAAGDMRTRHQIAMDWTLTLHRDPGARWQLTSTSSPIAPVTPRPLVGGSSEQQPAPRRGFRGQFSAGHQAIYSTPPKEDGPWTGRADQAPLQIWLKRRRAGSR